MSALARSLEERRPYLRWLVASVWLVYLQTAYAAAWHSPSALARAVSLVALTLFALGYIATFVVLRRQFVLFGRPSATPGWTAFGVLAALALLTLPGAGEEGLSTTVYLAAVAAAFLPGKHRVMAVVGVLAVAVGAEAFVPGWSVSSGNVLAILLAAVAIFGVTKVAERNQQLADAYREIARLAVTEERARMSRDLHDILGHSLTVITVKAELAGRLLPAQPERAAAEVGDIERLSREALADVRATISGQREVTLAAELVNARSALAGAGIEAQVPNAVDEVPGASRGIFGWAVREGVTNVVRHSGARHCRISLSPTSVEISDDGRGPSSGEGNGLRGLRERVLAAGGRLEIGRAGPTGGFRLRVELPPSGVPAPGRPRSDAVGSRLPTGAA